MDASPHFSFFLLNTGLNLALWDGTTQHTASIGVSINTWTHVAAVRKSNVLSLFIQGVLGYQGSMSANFAGSGVYYIGGNYGANNRWFEGYIDELRITMGAARYTANFTPPNYPSLRPTPLDYQVIDNEGFDYIGDTSAKNILSSDNIYYRELTPFDDFGTASIEGIVTIKGAPVSTEVFLFTLADKRLIATTMSNALGEYSFTNLKNQPYFVWARDETEVYNPVSRIAQNTL
jgi:hypothetical protein